MTPYRVTAIRPEEAELLHAAWSEATSRCAAYFGLDEDMIPSVLVLSLREKMAVLVRLFAEALATGSWLNVVSELGAYRSAGRSRSRR